MADGRRYFPPGKLPADVLARLLAAYSSDDPRLLIGPGVGADAAAIDFDERVLVVKSDPITFPTANVGSYLVHVNANDIACMGAEPRWLLVTALLPERSTNIELVESIFSGIAETAQALGIGLVGGHTEITIGLDRPILVGLLLGETTHAALLDLRRAQPGDAVLLANGIAIEGTSILAQTAEPEALKSVSQALLERAAQFIVDPGISVVQAARVLRASGCELRGMHDPTEGGLATALHELAAISGLGIDIERAAIPVYPETVAICSALKLDPLGLIASGALLAVVPATESAHALGALHSAGLPAARIGTLTPSARMLRLIDDQGVQPLPVFEVDEIARYYASAS